MNKTWEKLRAEPATTLQTVFKHIACGGTLISLAKTWDVSYSTISRWLTADEERRKVYDDACELRKEWLRDKILHELTAIASVDIRELFDDNGALRPASEWPDALTQAVSSIETKELFEYEGDEKIHVGYTHKVKVWDKVKTVELIGKSLSYFTEKHEHTGKISLADLVEASFATKPKDDD